MAWDDINPAAAVKVCAFPYNVLSLANLRQCIQVIAARHASHKPRKIKKGRILAASSMDIINKEPVLF
jgi:hypothetical protein